MMASVTGKCYRNTSKILGLVPYISGKEKGESLRLCLREAYKTLRRASAQSSPPLTIEYLSECSIIPTIHSALPFAIGAKASNAFNLNQFSFMYSCTDPLKTSVALSVAILFGGPNFDIISPLTRLITALAVE